MILGPGIDRTPLPKGFLASGVNCGVRRYRPDLGIIMSEMPCVAAGVFTKNTSKAAPVLYDQKLLPAENIMAIITNSGQANAATGVQGIESNHLMADAVAKNLNCQSNQILTASTGVIGEPLAVDKITQTIPELIEKATNVAERFAIAIMTTDLVPKTVYKEIELSQGKVCITGIAKGSGMIHPNMATMLGYLLTDVKLEIVEAQTLLNYSVQQSFNMISVDGEMSTNDSVFLLANGASGITIANEIDRKVFQEALLEISIMLAKCIVRDGEGATKLIEVKVEKSPSETLAIQLARSLTVSPLLKSAIHGESPNWGRILARLGAEGMPEDLFNQTQIEFQNQIVFDKGQQQSFKREEMQKEMKKDVIHICVRMNAGDKEAIAWGCDLSQRYVTINAEYLS